MNTSTVALIAILGVTFFAGVTYLSTYNGFMRKEQEVVGAERKVASCYQKRADLLVNLEATVNRYATHEQQTQTGVAQARAGAGKVQVPDNLTPETLSSAQAAMSSVFSRLMAVAEATPNLKADRGFINLQKQLKEIEGQCSLLRSRQIDIVKAYNTSLYTFPSNIVANMHGLTKKEQLSFEDEKINSKAPKLFQSK